MSVQSFYDAFADRYHLIYPDWESSIARQGAALDSLLSDFLPGKHAVLDVAVGIGTQALGLAARGYQVIGSDLSSAAVARARREAEQRGLAIQLSVADFQRLPVRSAGTPILLCGDNSLPHLGSRADILSALEEWYRCLQPGGGCLISMRDYPQPPAPGTVETRPYGERTWKGHRYLLRQTWTWRGPRYDVALEMTPLHDGPPLPTLEASYLAIPLADVQVLLVEAGFTDVQRIDGRLFQPVLVGFKSPVS
jgi:ubiquinone/menaquinone biosynthesis C-methylase UbiE